MVKRSQPAAGIVAIGIALLIAGCSGSGSRPNAGSTTTEIPSLSSTSSSTTSGASSTTTTAVTGTTITGLNGFSTPSGNIGCYAYSEGARCDIRNRTWQPPPQPASCPLAWGQGLVVGTTGPAQVVCAGDTAMGSPTVLAYGNTAVVGPFQCTSRTSGVNCENVSTHHGFTISIEAYELH